MKTKSNTLTPELFHKMDAYWRIANYLSVSQLDNPLLDGGAYDCGWRH
jgi:xylulose-5-phosphate/fructose-6-phosphate phosphoketolase